MRYVSTRGDAPALGFREVVLAGLARDGGLYVPERWPELTRSEIAALAGLSYAEAAFRIVGLFTGGEIAAPALRRMIDDSCRTFRHEAVTPLVQLKPNLFLLELFHGPTLAFKDVAMQFLARLMDEILAEKRERATRILDHAPERRRGNFAAREKADDAERNLGIGTAGEIGDLASRQLRPAVRNVETAVPRQSREHDLAETQRRSVAAGRDITHPGGLQDQKDAHPIARPPAGQARRRAPRGRPGRACPPRKAC